MKKSLFLASSLSLSAFASEFTPSITHTPYPVHAEPTTPAKPVKPTPPRPPVNANAPVTRAEFTALTRRVAAIEAVTKKAATPAAPLVRKPPGATK